MASEVMMKTPVLIIGSGPAGWSAAIYAARANLDPILVSGETIGGQLTITTDVENYPGFANTIQGPWLMEQFQQQALNVGTTMITDYIHEVDFSQTGKFMCYGRKNTFMAQSVIIATGAQAMWLGLPSEENLKVLGYQVVPLVMPFFTKIRQLL